MELVLSGVFENGGGDCLPEAFAAQKEEPREMRGSEKAI
jgi:hypothetical protein